MTEAADSKSASAHNETAADLSMGYSVYSAHGLDSAQPKKQSVPSYSVYHAQDDFDWTSSASETAGSADEKRHASQAIYDALKSSDMADSATETVSNLASAASAAVSGGNANDHVASVQQFKFRDQALEQGLWNEQATFRCCSKDNRVPICAVCASAGDGGLDREVRDADAADGRLHRDLPTIRAHHHLRELPRRRPQIARREEAWRTRRVCQCLRTCADLCAWQRHEIRDQRHPVQARQRHSRFDNFGRQAPVVCPGLSSLATLLS